jgi:sulfatase maturation enzyme AslB (radical SAM superfamily)
MAFTSILERGFAANGEFLGDIMHPYRELSHPPKLGIDQKLQVIPTIRLCDLVRARYPYYLPNPQKPTIACIEFCNVCGLNCSYCSTHDNKRAKGFMTPGVLSEVINGLV